MDSACIFFAFEGTQVDVAAVESKDDDYLTNLALEGLKLGHHSSRALTSDKQLTTKTSPVYAIKFHYDSGNDVIIECLPVTRCQRKATSKETAMLRNLATSVARTLSRRFIKERVYPSYLRPVA